MDNHLSDSTGSEVEITTIFSLQSKISLVSSNVQGNYKQDIGSWVKNLALLSHSLR